MRARRRADHGALAGLPALFGRQISTDCVSGENFYRCAINNFAGCCHVDPCALEDGCPTPDTDGPAPGAKSVPVEETVTFTKTIGAPAVRRTSTTTVTPTVTLSPTSSAGEGEPTTDAATTATDGSAVLPTDAGSLPKDQDHGRDGGGGLPGGAIAGIVIGILALIFLLLAAWLFLRRRKRRRLAAAEADFPPPSDENDEKFLGAAIASAASPVSSYLGGRSPSLASTPGLGKYPSPVSSPGLGNAARYPSPASTPGFGGDARGSKSSYASGLTASGILPAGVTPFPAIAQLDGTPVVLAEMDGTTTAAPAAPARLGEVSAGASSPARGQGVSLPTVAEDRPRPWSGALRGTLSSTEAERSGQTYVTSWSQYEGGPNK
ncbi:uncharacterized protein DNG_00307 [Cephalotrichum gorgonifer]|uniref:Uncharacterized protein n=1 Tax=Cephalotrichum gorgonifer TaxID=2041049 RepID=A0AAE8MQE6_9PEZI|nr:uncharacterized protein DNG_00307 [Cephalotrichum gorgonifer]